MNRSKVAVITGSGKRRVGNVVASELADRGFDLVIHYHRSATEASQTAAELQSRGRRALSLCADLTQDSEVRSFVDQVLHSFGRVDVLVNAAAIWNSTPLERVTADDVRKHFEVNTLGSFLCSQYFGLQMVKQSDGGSIVLLGDWAIQRPYRNYAAYFPSKGAIPAMTRSLAVELGTRNPRVRVNCIHPGPVMLPEGMPGAERADVIERTLVKREGSAHHVAQAVLLLVENEFVTGACVTVDGGRTIYAGDEATGS